MSNIIQIFKKEEFSLGQFAIFFATAIAFNLYFLSNFTLSIDDEIAAFRTDPSAWIGQGRWLLYLVEKQLFPQPVLPYVPNVVFCATMAAAYALLVRAHDLRDDWRIYFSFPVFCAFPIWPFIAAFYPNLPALSFGVLFVCAAAFLHSHSPVLAVLLRREAIGSSLANMTMQAVLLAMALGAYQSLFMLYLAMGLGVIARAALSGVEDDRFSAANAWRAVWHVCLVGCCALAIYLLISRIALWLMPFGTAYIGNFFNLQELVRNPQGLAYLFLSEMRSYYLVASQKYGGSLSAVPWLIAIALVAVAMNVRAKQKSVILFVTLSFFAVLVSPFLLTLITAIEMPVRAFVSVPYVIWFLAICALGSKKLVITVASVLVLIALQFQAVRATGNHAAAVTIALEQDKLLAADLYRRMAGLGFDESKPIMIDIFGRRFCKTAYPAPWSSTFGASFFGWDEGNINRMVRFMRLLGYPKITPLAEKKRLLNTRKFLTMPSWPAPGSVVKQGDVFLIKLSDKSDFIHARSLPAAR
ncbi:conserved hypothetical protein [Desulfarculus baarsii DSM 2075]|uniref:Glucosyl transferase GtrII n=1 Tax=Desulfarculus baarsii (strain ATCC 33931 / DSM 2075 / LMG 7858 / VKM B-1802 / 2st14) TaxID=644282 RepID=E1QG14_DESB2|nr:glucosyltransferase domain-containing protein [Desulfarculus baarsii]ADK84624.1 conserved hypothetical protein [Desulfarculus baarsii DSM 2075]